MKGLANFSIDPAAISKMTDEDLIELEKELACLEWSGDYRAFVVECLGRNYEAMMDPGVSRLMKGYAASLNDWLETRHEQRSRRNILYMPPRECAKTEGISIPTVPWLNIHLPDLAAALVSATQEDMSESISRPVRAIFEQTSPDEKMHYFGPFHAPQKKWTDKELNTAVRRSNRKDPTLRVSSIDKGLTGGHYDVVIFDDPVTKAKAEREGENWYRKCIEQYIELNTTIRKDGLFILVGTRYAEGDLIGYIKDNEIAPVVRKLRQVGAPPGELPEDFERNWYTYAHLADWEVFFGQVHHEEPDGSISLGFPYIWPEERIAKSRQDPTRGESFYASQLQNTPAQRADNPIQPHHIERAWWPIGEPIPPGAYGHLNMTMDLAFKDGEAYLKQKGDWSVIQIWGQEAGRLYLVHGWHGRPTQEEFGREWIRLLEWALIEHQTTIRYCTYDKPIGMGSFGDGQSPIAKWLWGLANERGLVCPHLKEMTRSAKKLNRILGVTGYWQDGRVRLLRGVPGAQELANEMLMLGISKHDDHADAAADAFNSDLYYSTGGVGKASAALPNADRGWDWYPAGADMADDIEDDFDNSAFAEVAGWQ